MPRKIIVLSAATALFVGSFVSAPILDINLSGTHGICLASLRLLPLIPVAQAARGKFDKATAEPAEFNLKQGLQLIKDSNYEAAIDSFQQAIYFSRNHYNPEAYKLLGICLKATRQYTKAMEAFKTQLSQTTEKEPDVHIDLAECYLELGDTDQAREELNKAFVDQVTSRGTHRQKFAQGELWEKMGSPGQALDFYASALDEKPFYTDAAMAMAKMNVLLKRYSEALRTYRDILDHGPMYRKVNFEQLYYNMGTCFNAKGDHQSALDHYRLALESNPDSFDAHLALGKMLDEEKHYTSAMKEYEAALRTAPRSASAQRDPIMRRVQFIQAQLSPKEAAPVIKPSPQMRQEYEDQVQQRDDVKNTVPPTKDSGF